jgi:tetratricopeptide (TPR) repeat protein
MKRYILIPVVLVCLAGTVSADHPAVERAESLLEYDRLEQALDVLEEALDEAYSTPEKAELYTALSRFTLQYADSRKMAGADDDTLLALYAEGEEYGNQAIDLAPDNYEAYFWRASNAGRWGQIKGVFDALDKARQMQEDLDKAVEINPDHSLSWYALGQLYEQVPGIAFGNDDFAVSLGRKSVDAMLAEVRRGIIDEIIYDYYTQLARHLYERNWNERRRNREYDDKRDAFRSASGVLEKHFHYEGTVNIEDMSDRDEAEEILEWTIRELEGEWNRSKKMNEDLEVARETMEELF